MPIDGERAAWARLRRRGWRMVAGGGLLVALVASSGALGSLSGVADSLLALLALASTLVGLRIHRPRLRYPWMLIAAALALFVVGGAARSEMHTLGDLSSRRSLVPDVITVPGYVLGAGGLLALSRSRRHGQHGGFDIALDAMIAALAVLTLAWVLLVDPALHAQHVALPLRLTLACYPPLSVILLAITASIAFTPGMRASPSFRLLLLAIAMTLIGDILYMLVEIGKVSVTNTVTNLPYGLGFVAFSATVLHPSMHDLCEPVDENTVLPSRIRVAVVAAALAVPACVALFDRSHRTGDRLALTAMILLLTGAVVLRVLRALGAHARSQAQLAYQATHDSLTGLPNRQLGRQFLHHAIARAHVAGERVGLLFIDLDRFKLVNDTLGHGAGDDLLVSVGRRLADNCRATDLVARVGGDEFIVVLPNLAGERSGIRQADNIRRCFQVPFAIRGTELYASASIGVAFAGEGWPDVDADRILQDANTAMYQAKDIGRNGVMVFDSSLRVDAVDRLALDHDLRQALDRDEIRVHFQPILAAPAGPVMGFEALARWRHPVRGDVPPSSFIPLAEDSGQIIELGTWVLQRACYQIAEWRKGLAWSQMYVSVNLSARQLQQESLLDIVSAALDAADLPGSAVCLELTESLLIDNADVATHRLSALKRLGIRLSIDDFGTGYSSLAYLKRFPVDFVKIDRSFIDDLDRDDTSEETLVAAIVAMAGALGMATIAEGVETRGQSERLARLGCDYVQGFGFAQALPAEEIPSVVARFGAASLTLLHTNKAGRHPPIVQRAKPGRI